MFRQFFCGNIKIIFNRLLYFFIESIFLSNILSNILGITLGIMVSDTSHYENDVPSNWAVCRLEDIAVIGTGATPDTRIDAYYNGNIPWINSSSTKGEYIEIPSSYISEKAISETNCQIYPSGSLIMAMYGEGKTRGQVSELCFDSATNQACAAIVPIDNQMKGFLKAYLKSKYYHIRTLAEGGNQPNLNLSKISQYIIPIPPIDEQVRIIAAIEKWFALIETLETTKDDLQASIVQAKSKILDLAIHGKLVPQDPNDEPAIELLKRINPKFTPCDNAHYPFDVPHNWVWAKGLDIFKPMKATSPLGDTFKYIDIDAIDNKRNVVTSVKVLNTKQAPSRASRYTEKGCVLFSMVRPYLRNIAMVTENDCIASTGFFVCLGKGCLLPKFCYYQMLSNYVVDGLNDFMKGDNSPSITKAQIEEYIFPLPPYNEQQRIVTKIEELFAVLDKIQKSIEA